MGCVHHLGCGDKKPLRLGRANTNQQMTQIPTGARCRDSFREAAFQIICCLSLPCSWLLKTTRNAAKPAFQPQDKVWAGRVEAQRCFLTMTTVGPKHGIVKLRSPSVCQWFFQISCVWINNTSHLPGRLTSVCSEVQRTALQQQTEMSQPVKMERPGIPALDKLTMIFN